MRCHSPESRLHCIQKNKKRGAGEYRNIKKSGKRDGCYSREYVLSTVLLLVCFLKNREFALLGEVMSHCQKKGQDAIHFSLSWRRLLIHNVKKEKRSKRWKREVVVRKRVRTEGSD